MTQASLDIDRIESLLQARRWTRAELFRRMEDRGYEGGMRSLYNIFDYASENPNLSLLAILAQVLGTSIDELVIIEGASAQKSKKG